MTDYQRSPSWMPWVIGIGVATGVGIAAYFAGMHHAIPAAVAPGVHHHHWGVFPFFPLFPFVAFFGFLFLMRMLVWGGGWRRHYRGYYGPAWYDDPARWDEWHRRAHEHMQKDGDDTRR
jgi:hypothetical protein